MADSPSAPVSPGKEHTLSRKRRSMKSTINATLRNSKKSLNLAWGNLKKTVSGANVLRTREASLGDDDDGGFLKFRNRNIKGKRPKPSMVEKAGIELNVVYDGDRVRDERNIHIEQRVQHLMKAKRREEVFDATLENDPLENESRTSRASLKSVKTYRTNGSTDHNPIATLRKSIKNSSFNFSMTLGRAGRKGKSKKSNSESAKRFMNLDIPKYPKPGQDKTLIRNALSENMFFNELSSEEIDMLVDAMQSRSIAKDKEIITEGDSGDEFYVVRSGEFVITSKSKDKELSKVGSGGSFGELALVLDSKRMVTIAAGMNSQVYVLPRLTYRKIVAFSQNDRLVNTRKCLRMVPLLKDLSKEQISELADNVQYVKFNQGDPIIVKGEVGDIFYFIKSGSVQCTKIKGEDDISVRDITLGQNEYFGERALLVDEPRAANVIALEDVECLALDRESFTKHLGSLSDILQRNLSIRALKAMPLLNDLNDKQLSKLLDSFEETRFLPGEQIIEQGSKNKKFYIIASGEVEVTLFDKTDRQKHTVVGKLKPGEYFGESSFKSGSTANAEVTAVGEVVCKVIEARKHLRYLKPITDTVKRNHTTRQKHALEAVKMTTAQLEAFEKTIELTELKHIKTLGTGSFGRVKLVEHKKTGDAFALKILQKADVVRCKQQHNVMNEKMVMMKSQHPFILVLHRTFTTKNCLYFLLELIQGGELFSLLYNNRVRIRSSGAKFFAACVIDAIGYLHKRQIVYRDLKPENIMIDNQGYVRVVDFGFAKKVVDKTYTLCGTPEYLPPETITQKGHNRSVDYWAIGVLIYEMIAGFSPFSDADDNDQSEIFSRVIKGRYMFPREFPREAKKLVKELLKPNPKNRLGMFREGPDEIKHHMWFVDLDWNALLAKTISPPWVPEVTGNLDTTHFDEFDEDDKEVPYRGSNRYWANF